MGDAFLAFLEFFIGDLAAECVWGGGVANKASPLKQGVRFACEPVVHIFSVIFPFSNSPRWETQKFQNIEIYEEFGTVSKIIH